MGWRKESEAIELKKTVIESCTWAKEIDFRHAVDEQTAENKVHPDYIREFGLRVRSPGGRCAAYVCTSKRKENLPAIH
jgi:hypothetical protein